MTTQQMAVPAADPTGPESEIISNFLRVSGAYLFSCVYRDSLRAAYVRHAASDPVAEHESRYRELLRLSPDCNAAVIDCNPAIHY